MFILAVKCIINVLGQLSSIILWHLCHLYQLCHVLLQKAVNGFDRQRNQGLVFVSSLWAHAVVFYLSKNEAMTFLRRSLQVDGPCEQPWPSAHKDHSHAKRKQKKVNANPTGYYYVLKDHGLNQKILVRIAFKLQCLWLYLLKRTIQVVYCFLSNLYKSVYHYILRMYKALLHFIIKKHITE